MNPVVRKASVADAESIAHLGSTTFDETFGHLFVVRQELEDYLATTFSIAKIQSSLQKENNEFWLASVGDQPVGYAKLKKHCGIGQFEAQATTQLQKIYVLRAFLDRQIGIGLLKPALASLQSSYLWLSVLHTNERAIRFYEKNGFQKYDKHFHTIGSQVFEFERMIRIHPAL